MITAFVIGILLLGLIGLPCYTFWKARKAEALYPPVGQFVTVDGVRLHYVRKGSGPPVVLLHGSDGFLQDFTWSVLEPLASEFDVIAFDRPGHGYSGMPSKEAPTLQTQARLIRRALQQMGIERPLFVGHSWSGALLLWMALDTPEEAAGLVLLSPWVYDTDRESFALFSLLQIPLLGRLLTILLLPFLKGRLIQANLAQAFTPEEVPAGYARMARALWQRRPVQTRLFAQENSTALKDFSALMPRYSQVRVPVVIVAGEADSVVASTQHAARLHKDIPASRLFLLPDTGHELPQTRPEAVMEAVRRCRQMAAAPEIPEESDRQQSLFPSGGSEPEAAYQRARELVFRFGWNATAYQILNEEMEHWFAEDGEAVVGFVRQGRVRVAAGAPLCAENRLAEVVAEFEQAARQAGERVCYFGAASRLLSALEHLPEHSVLTIGAQPVWRPANWSAILKRNASLRAQLNRARNKGVSVQEWPQERAYNHPQLQQCLTEWLASHPFPTLHFLTEPVTLDRLADRRIFVAEWEGAPIGFLITTPVPDRHGWLIEQIVRGEAAVNGAAELMIDSVMRCFAEEGYDYVTLGLAPLSRRAPVPFVTPLPWLRVLLAWARAHGTRFYNFDGLDAFKAKFKPDAWEPLFAISNEPHFSLRTLYAIAGAFSDGPPIRALARAIGAALRQEAHWMQARLKARGKEASEAK